jgi:hypothetical protein
VVAWVKLLDHLLSRFCYLFARLLPRCAVPQSGIIREKPKDIDGLVLPDRLGFRWKLVADLAREDPAGAILPE